MKGKIILSLVLMAVATVQLAHGKDTKDTKHKELQCYTCDSVDSCKTPKKITCSQQSANETREHLHSHFEYISDHISPDFECLKMSLVEKNNHNHTAVTIRGCIYMGGFSAQSIPLNSSLALKDHSVCMKNLCNPAGTFSSSFTIMISSIFGLILAKLFVM